MFRLFSWLISLFLVGMGLPAKAQQLLPPALNSFITEVPKLPAPLGQSRYYGATNASPAWVIAQWDIPGSRLSSFTKEEDGSLISHSEEANVQIKNGILTISQSGATLPCTHPGGKPREWDLFFAPSAQHFTPLIALSRLASLIQTATITVDGSILPGKACKVNLGDTLIAIVLIDREVHPAQVFFYQLELSQTCHSIPGGQNCSSDPNRAIYFSRSNPFGADEYEPLLGHPFLHNGKQIHFSENLLPRLKAIIEKGPAGMDHKISDWVVANAYYGQHIWGGVKLTSKWSNLKLTAKQNF
ncbi:hypothetical protein [Acidocella aminolytica]|uniref:Uncharacterized protein n=1 Tax=Acidocella aminolytica 101 = DSM 11237 TaxID=1120923 RepID=A0A0D6PCT2_9PROT|nr:hypothetical protein [Acidocella aminolytica]GAN79477.1 hypothetical protein Aam_021_065 [Acidocella aminolytica 101 = DSM 11237]SHE46821.1 hypothetical protein SAMN02746095_00564 [Acidocella aminolytica 101 = DSM 11237]